MVVHRDHCAGLEFEFAGADSVFYPEDLLGASGEGFQGSVFVPFHISVSCRVAEGFVFYFYDFDRHIAEGVVGAVAGYVGEGGG